MSFYWIVMLGSIAGPLFLSFDKRVAFYKFIPGVLLSVLFISVPFLCWDEFFTQKNIWGFNPDYVQGVYIGHLPIEEVVFFLFIPYCCIFVHEVLKSYFPNLKKDLLGRAFAFTAVLTGLGMATMHSENWYTLFACVVSVLVVINFGYVRKAKWFNDFAFTYLIVLIPFTIVNGLLTGGYDDKIIVWYSDLHIIGIRMWTIPIEDLHYNLAMLLPMIAVFEWWKSRKIVNSKGFDKR